MLRRMGVAQQFVILVALGIAALVAGVVVIIAHNEQEKTEAALYRLSSNEISSLHSLIVTVMAIRPDDGDNIGIRVFNNWFNSRNADYPGQVWSAWGPKVAAHMAEMEPGRAPKVPRDDIDREAFETGKTVARMTGDAYRYSMPIVLGVTEGANQDVCRSCHEGMGLKDGEVIAVLSTSLSTAEAKRQLNVMLAGLIAGGIVATAGAVFGVRSIFTRLVGEPLENMAKAMGTLSRGNVDVELPIIDRHDEIGHISDALKVFKTNAVAKRAMESLAAGEAEAKARRVTRMEELIGVFETSSARVLAEVMSSTSRMMDTANTMAAESGEALGSVETAAHQARAANSSVHSVAEAAETMAAHITEIERQATLSNQVASSATRVAADANTRVLELTDAASRITEVVAMITGIAAKTNMLALNANIEAVRAGEAGRGFVVVANEVKGLAKLTMEATSDIGSQIGSIHARTTDTAETIIHVSDTISRIEDAARAISELVQHQGQATRDIVHGMENAASGASDASASIETVATTIRLTDSSAKEVVVALKGVEEMMAVMQGEIGRFLEGIRTA
jgi:methyl-accepting chemotaxis protein